MDKTIIKLTKIAVDFRNIRKWRTRELKKKGTGFRPLFFIRINASI
jgi:hypothetical protein